MTDLLIVPIYLDALVLDKPTAVVEAFADFSRLPYFDGERDVNPDVPNLSEEILSQPFQNQNLYLEAGVHLHWALPDALTRGSKGANGKTEFPAVPNRWLVTRLRNNSKEAQWVIESDYLYDPKALPSDSTVPGQTVSYPYPDDSNCRFRYLGKVTNANTWQAGPEDPKTYLEKLTAVGYGEPAFAAFYPNCFSVFGFHDGSDGIDLNGLTYQVIGWYSKGKPYDTTLPFIVSDWQFQSADILNWEQLASQLINSGNNKNPAIGQIYNLLNPTTKTLLSQSGQTLQKKDQEQVLNDFNRILTKKELYLKEAFKGLQTDDVLVQQLLGSDSSQWSDQEKKQINRRLIEAAFLNIIAPCRDWLEIARDEYKWSVTAQINKQDFVKKLSVDIWNYLIQEPVEWLKKNDDNRAWVTDRIQRNKEVLDQYKEQTADINNTLDYAVLSKQPERFVCYAQVTFEKSSDSPKKDPDIAVGNTSTEALSAYLADQVTSDNKLKSIIEDQLEALHLSSGLEKRRLDIGPKFKEARHSKGFKPATAGHIWTLRPESNQQAGQTVNRSDQVTLPLELAESLNTLNDLQQAYDRARFEIESLRSQLFADWYKYMLCAYPPLDTPDDYPDIDEVKRFIDINSLQDSPLEQKIGKVGELKVGKHDAAGQPALQVMLHGDLADQIFAALNILLDSDAMSDLQTVVESDIGDWNGFLAKLKDFPQLNLPAISLDPNTDAQTQKKSTATFLAELNSRISSRDFYSLFEKLSNLADASTKLISKLKSVSELPKHVWMRLNRLLLESLFPQNIAHRPDYILKRIPAPRYWEPNDPVVLVAGDLAKPSDRHGPEGELQENGLLRCGIISSRNSLVFDSTGLNATWNTIHSQVGALGYQKWVAQPWNPIMLEWEVEFLPSVKGSLPDINDPTQTDVPQYRLEENDPEFSNAANVHVVPIANVYSGRSILTPHAKVQLEIKLQQYLVEFVRQNLWDNYQIVNKGQNGLPGQFDATWVTDHLDDFSGWFRQTNKVLTQYFKETSDSDFVDDNFAKFAAWSQKRFDLKKLFHEQKGLDYKGNEALFLDWYKDWLLQQSEMVAQLEEAEPAFKKDQSLWLSQNVEKGIAWYQGQIKFTFRSANYINAYKQVNHTDFHILTQSLGGFNQALLMHKQTLQLPVDDPLGFDDYEGFTECVNAAVGKINSNAPQPLNEFNPIRAGSMKLLRLRLIDTFGQVREINCEDKIISTSDTMPPNDADKAHSVSLPPRLAQAARLNFRWLAAEHNAAGQDEVEMNDHPATSPICGWILPNNLDSSLMVYEAGGGALGSLDASSWRSAPGRYPPVSIVDIPNPHLRNVVAYLYKHRADVESTTDDKFFECFLSAIENALENIDPENFAQHEALALLMGRPIAVVRASLNLELRGMPAINQDWNLFRQDMQGTATQKDSQGIDHLVRTTGDFTKVVFPIRIGEFEQLNDGLIGYWVEHQEGYEGETFYAPQARSENGKPHKDIRFHEANDPAVIQQSIDHPPQILTILLDPRGAVHATCGILPTKSIQIPPDQFADALRAIEVTFLSAPVITDIGKINLPLPDEPGYQWSWLEKENGVWADETTIGSVTTQATFASKQAIKEGWLKLRQRPDQKLP